MGISLIANSGIQFVDKKVLLGEGSKPMRARTDFYLERSEDELRMVLPVFDTNENAYLDPDTNKKIPEDNVRSYKFKQALQCFENRWIPLPYFRQGAFENKLRDGPIGWARLWFGAEVNTDSYNIVLAFDTHIGNGDSDSYLKPEKEDSFNSIFEVATQLETAPLVQEEWCQEWLKNIVKERGKKVGIRGVFDTDTDNPKVQDIHVMYVALTLFLTLLKGLKEAEAFPSITLQDSNDDEKRVIDVDLILDIGNSRSCGILMETSKPQEPVSFSNCSRLELRDLSIPFKKYDEPFEMRSEFAKPDFGDESASKRSGSDRQFFWPSLVRVGPEAIRTSVINSNTRDVSGMSSPKRYLWDDNDQRVMPWSLSKPARDHSPRLALYECFTESGSVCEPNSPDSSTNATYPRSTLMKFVFMEILLHAMSQINSYEFRNHNGQDFFRRRLRRIVITSPTAMLLTEKHRLRQYAKDAILALNLMMGEETVDSSVDVVPNPDYIRPDKIVDNIEPEDINIDWGYDEATCVQLAFLYGEIHEKFMNDGDLYFNTYGHIRKVVNNANTQSYFPDQKTVTIASLDIGGGTTDLMICSYQHEKGANSTVIRPIPEFWEGFNLAGDDILRAIIEKIVIPGIQTDLELHIDSQKAAEAISILFGRNHGGQSAKSRQARKHFANQVAVPIAQEMLDYVKYDSVVVTRSYSDFFINYNSPQRDLEQFIEETFQQLGAKDYKLRKLVLSISPKEINQVIIDIMRPTLKSLGYIIGQYKCDFMLLAGRPSTLPIIRDVLIKSLPVTPDRLISLGDYQIGNWYPYSNAKGVISDPKTCVSVGATIALVGGQLGKLMGFRIDTQHLRSRIKSTAKYIGFYDEQRIRLRNQDIVFVEGTDEAEIIFQAPIMFGMRQLNDEKWRATPIYHLNYASDEEARRLAQLAPFRMILARHSNNPELIQRIESVERVEGGKEVAASSFKIKLQTLPEEHGHWLDTGIFLVAQS